MQLCKYFQISVVGLQCFIKLVNSWVICHWTRFPSDREMHVSLYRASKEKLETNLLVKLQRHVYILMSMYVVCYKHLVILGQLQGFGNKCDHKKWEWVYTQLHVKGILHQSHDFNNLQQNRFFHLY